MDEKFGINLPKIVCQTNNMLCLMLTHWRFNILDFSTKQLSRQMPATEILNPRNEISLKNSTNFSLFIVTRFSQRRVLIAFRIYSAIYIFFSLLLYNVPAYLLGRLEKATGNYSVKFRSQERICSCLPMSYYSGSSMVRLLSYKWTCRKTEHI